MFKLVLEKAEEPEIKLPTSAGSLKKQETSRKTSISASPAGLGEAQARIKISGRNINNLRYADNTILLPESEEELESLEKVKEES